MEFITKLQNNVSCDLNKLYLINDVYIKTIVQNNSHYLLLIFNTVQIIIVIYHINLTLRKKQQTKMAVVQLDYL